MCASLELRNCESYLSTTFMTRTDESRSSTTGANASSRTANAAGSYDVSDFASARTSESRRFFSRFDSIVLRRTYLFGITLVFSLDYVNTFLLLYNDPVSSSVAREGVTVMEEPQTPGSDCNSNPATDSIQQDLVGSEFVQDNVEYQWFIDYG